jgi:hypothetical protein
MDWVHALKALEYKAGWLKMEVNFLLCAMCSAFCSCRGPWACGFGIAAALNRKRRS